MSTDDPMKLLSHKRFMGTEIYGDGLFLMLYLLNWFWWYPSMSRRARIDAPGALQHIICRGIQLKSAAGEARRVDGGAGSF